MLWYDKIIINLYIAKYIWGGDGNMKKKRIEQNEIKRYFLIIAAFLSFMILSLLFFLSWLQQDVEVSSRKTVATNVERQSYHLKSVLDIQFNYLTGMASYMGEGEAVISCSTHSNETVWLLTWVKEKICFVRRIKG